VYPFNLGIYGGLQTYGSINLTETSPPQSFVEPLGLVEMKSYLSLPPSWPEEDLILEMISAARWQAEIAQNRELVRKQYDLSMDYWPSYRIELRTPLVSVDLVRYQKSDGSFVTMAANTDYIVDLAKHPGIIAPTYNTTWPSFTPWPSSAILIRFTSGMASSDPFWSARGALIKKGMRLLISAWFNNRLPFEKGLDAMSEYPYAVTSCLNYGAVPRVG
jgi:uncharacterized phiE125 gp8 family phage protein